MYILSKHGALMSFFYVGNIGILEYSNIFDLHDWKYWNIGIYSNISDPLEILEYWNIPMFQYFHAPQAAHGLQAPQSLQAALHFRFQRLPRFTGSRQGSVESQGSASC